MDASPLTLDNETGVTEYARRTLANDARLAIVRVFSFKGHGESHTETNTFLAVWSDYTKSDVWQELYVIHNGETHLVHRKPNPRVGFTSFAKERLLYPTGHPKDTKSRVYVMGGKDVEGKRLRREMNATILVVWLDYASITEYTHLWVKWKDGRRHLVHRKGNS